MEIDV